jgi:hypothetical protein
MERERRSGAVTRTASGSSPVAIRITLTALPITSTGATGLLGPFGIGAIVFVIPTFREASDRGGHLFLTHCL